jgi:hypothetical protein
MALQAIEQCPNFAPSLERGLTSLNDAYLDLVTNQYIYGTVKVHVMYEAPGMAWESLLDSHASVCVLYFQPIYSKNLCVILF